MLLRYTRALITQMWQTAVRNRHDSLDRQLCRSPLLSRDRLRGGEFVTTQELIANMFGMRREGMTQATLKLQKAGMIGYAPGHISFLGQRAVCGSTQTRPPVLGHAAGRAPRHVVSTGRSVGHGAVAA